MTSEDQEPQPAPAQDPDTQAAASAKPSADDVTTQIQNTHAQVLAAITTGYKSVEDAMRIAEEAVRIAVSGASKAMDMAQQAAKKPDA